LYNIDILKFLKNNKRREFLMEISIFKSLWIILRNAILYRKRCENCSSWMSRNCTQEHYGAVGPLGKCEKWTKKE